jgi:hypothetical protein
VSKYDEKIKSFDEELLEGYPDAGDLVRLSLSPEFGASIAQQSYETLISCAYSLARFVIHLQVFGNRYQAGVSILKRKLDFAKAKAIANLDDIKAKDTDKSKLARAYKENPNLEKSEEELSLAEEKAKYYEKIPDAIRDLISVIKYELRKKEQERERGRFNGSV